MDADRFDTLARAVPAGRSRRRAVLAALGGSLAALSLGTTAKKKRKKNKRKSPKPCPTCVTCPEPTVCSPRDTCPRRTCCVCNTSSPTPGCRFGADSDGSSADFNAKCEAACGGPGTWDSGVRTGMAGSTVACNSARTQCLFVACPI
jgi:hypothetical protein